MLVPSCRSHLLLLLLLLLLAASSQGSVRGQHVSVSKISSGRVEAETAWDKTGAEEDKGDKLSLLSDPVVVAVFGDHVNAIWERTGPWGEVEDFTVFLNTTDILCRKEQHCNDTFCIFYGDQCGSLQTCSHNELTVSGNGTSHTVPFQAAPEPVTRLRLEVEQHNLHINWTNPPIESSTCYNYTQVQVREWMSTFHTTHHSLTEESVTVPLGCTVRSGTVEVVTRGGDGASTKTQRSYSYYGSDLVFATSCRPVGCYGVELAWEYNPVCPEVTHFCVEEASGTKLNCTKDAAATSLQVTGLEADEDYHYEINAHGEDGRLGRPAEQTCSTYDAAVRNLVTVGSSPTSCTAGWDPPACLAPEGLVYQVDLNKGFGVEDTTTNTSYVWTDLEDYTRYRAGVAVEGHPRAESIVFTQPRRLTWLRLQMAGDDSVLVEWEAVTDYADTPGYIVTWDSKDHYTDDHRYTIEGYKSTEALGRVCVAVFMQPYPRTNVTGPRRCSDDPAPDTRNQNVLLIVLLSVGIAAVALVAVGVIITRRKRQKATELSLE